MPDAEKKRRNIEEQIKPAEHLAGSLFRFIRVHNLLDAPHTPVFQHYLDAARVLGTGRENAGDDAFGQCAGALVLLLDDLHAHANFEVTAFGDAHLTAQLYAQFQKKSQVK